MCQHNLPCSIVYAHCLLPGRAFASLYVLLFLEKEAEIGGRVVAIGALSVKDKDNCPIEIIKGLTDKGQFQYLTKLMGPQEGTYLYATQFHSLR